MLEYGYRKYSLF